MVGSVKAVRLINPTRFMVIAESVKKTDKGDARMIARFLSKGVELPEVRVGSREMKELRSNNFTGSSPFLIKVVQMEESQS